MVFAWKKVYEQNKNKISAKQDVFICYVHLCLIRRGFVCMGLGDTVSYLFTFYEYKSQIMIIFYTS